MKNEELLRGLLPLTVKKVGREYKVYTGNGFPVGRRLLKGVSPPRIDDFGPFKKKEEADVLALTLTFHIQSDWPDRSRYRSKKARQGTGLA